MKGYRINILGLSNNVHQFEFQVDDKFFLDKKSDLVQKGNVKISVWLDKHETFIELKIELEGEVELTCDRSLETFDYPIKLSERILFKYGEEEKEVDEDVYIITRDKDSIELGQFFYEFISLGIPMKRLHPKYQEETEDDEIIYSSKPKDDEVDPRWDALKKLK